MVRVIPSALGHTEGEEKMVFINPSMNLLESALDNQNVKGFPSMSVPIVTLDSLLSDPSIQPPDFIKVDIEGAEDSFLNGARHTLVAHSPTLLIEVHGPQKAQKVWQLLKGLNYHWWWLTPWGLEEVTDINQLSSLFSKELWTAHFLIARPSRTPSRFAENPY